MAEFNASDFRIPKCVFNLDDEGQYSAPSCPVLVFINSRSGGQLGGDLLKTYKEILDESQVFDLGQEPPEEVLQTVFGNLERLKHLERQKNRHIGLAEKILNNLRLVVAGGDGTASWLLGVVCDLKLARPPPIATVPLGTGNNLPFAFGWGKKNPGTDSHSVQSFLLLVKNAKPMNIDKFSCLNSTILDCCKKYVLGSQPLWFLFFPGEKWFYIFIVINDVGSWHLIMRMKAPNEGSCEPLAPLELPHALHAFRRLSISDSLNKEGYHTFRGGFWNYFSIGMDAQVSYDFHSARKMHPEKFKNQIVNQATYLKLGLEQGLHSSHDSSRNITEIAMVEVIESAGRPWKKLEIPPHIKSIICLNLPSFSGGLDPWGTPNKKQKYKEFTPAYVDDGRIEVVGFKDAWQGLLLLFSQGHGTRLAQAHRIRFIFYKGAAKETYMRMDGEPWKQPLPSHDDGDREVVEISHHGQVTMLAVANCRSKSLHGAQPVVPGSPSAPSTPCGDSDEESEEKRKFGAAETFKLPDDIHISHLS